MRAGHLLGAVVRLVPPVDVEGRTHCFRVRDKDNKKNLVLQCTDYDSLLEWSAACCEAAALALPRALDPRLARLAGRVR